MLLHCASSSSTMEPVLGGCQALVHYCAVPSTIHVPSIVQPVHWIGPPESIAKIVIPISHHYFTGRQYAILDEIRSCGCKLEEVGCAVCGNPLGARVIHPCPSCPASHTISSCLFLPAAVRMSDDSLPANMGLPAVHNRRASFSAEDHRESQFGHEPAWSTRIPLSTLDHFHTPTSSPQPLASPLEGVRIRTVERALRPLGLRPTIRLVAPSRLRRQGGLPF
ncbi:hypothetical protein R3P38DRAFT_2934571 [Favolaschia claudopus]|uniref:Uncharacterized protein n=1 Tax=Favolaschia claudopus TaxID=2862362 RepID=A0AAW0BRC2_9AGAR